MNIRRRLVADIAIAIFVLVFITYMFTLVLFLFGWLYERATVLPLATSVSSLWLCTFVAWAFAFPDLRRRNVRYKHLWGVGFVLVAALAIPMYYFAIVRPTMNAQELSERIKLSDAAVLGYLVLAMVVFGWSILLALSRSPLSTAYQAVSAAHAITTFVFWACSAVVLVRRTWPIGRKLLWAVALILGSFVALPLFYGLHMRGESVTG
jgi:hypothetical protein